MIWNTKEQIKAEISKEILAAVEQRISSLTLDLDTKLKSGSAGMASQVSKEIVEKIEGLMLWKAQVMDLMTEKAPTGRLRLSRFGKNVSLRLRR